MSESLGKPEAPPASLADDLLSGIKAIGDFVGKPERQTYHLCTTGKLPGAFQIGRIWHLRKSTFVRAIAALERGAA